MAKRRPPRPPKPKQPAKPRIDPFARMLASKVSEAHGVGSAATLDVSDEIGNPRGYVGVRNIALQRALGTPGIPLGRITEISGWPGAGKSTALDQILAQCQAENGVGVLADTERGRNRAYMTNLGVRPESLVWIGGQTVEAMFEEVETLARESSSVNAEAWHDAMIREGLKPPSLGTYNYVVFDPTTDKKNAKPVASYTLTQWTRGHAARLMEWQESAGLPVTGVRDAATREGLRPCIIHAETKADRAEALRVWAAGETDNPLVQAADRPIVVGWDSVAGTATEAELEGSSRDVHPATAARAIRRNLRRLIQLIDDEAIAVILVNQRYEKIPMGGRPQWGKTSETYGGGGIKYHTTLRIEVDKRGDIYGSGRAKAGGFPPVGQECVIRIGKNKLADPFRTERYGLVFGQGACDAWAIHEDLKERGIIRASGGWSRFADATIMGDADKSFRGWEELRDLMTDNPALSADLRAIYMEGAV